MDIQTDQSADTATEGQPPTSMQSNAPTMPKWGELAILLGLAIIAFIPRLILATQLDVVTDEIVYILGGKIYLPLLAHLTIGTSGWLFNYEHPPFVKLLIGTALAINALLGHVLNSLLAARVPSILTGTLLVVMMYWLGRRPFGRVISLLAALSLAVSPWLVYFSALAYLDMTMTALVTIVFLILWYAVRRPRLYLLMALLLGLAAASKYTAVLIVPGIVLFTAYYFFVLRFYIPKAQRPPLPWLWWLGAIVLAPLCFLAVDPAIWPSPISLLIHSFNFEWAHSVRGHLTFLAGRYSDHIPHWAILYIVFTKMSAFITIPAIFFVLFALVQLVRFHLRQAVTLTEATNLAFLLIWLLSTLGMFSLLNIVVGTHYHLPLAPPVAFAGAFGLATLFGYRRGLLTGIAKIKTTHSTSSATLTNEQVREQDSIRHSVPDTVTVLAHAPGTAPDSAPIGSSFKNYGYKKHGVRGAITVAILAICLVGPHLWGLVTIPDAEGYASEFFHGENQALQVAYPGYRDALEWIDTHTTQQHVKIGLVALVDTLTGQQNVSWYTYNQDFAQKYQLIEAHPTDTSFPYAYLVWPMHLVQRGYTIPPNWHARIVHVVMGGNTIYCYIMARSPASVRP